MVFLRKQERMRRAHGISRRGVYRGGDRALVRRWNCLVVRKAAKEILIPAGVLPICGIGKASCFLRLSDGRCRSFTSCRLQERNE